MLKVTDESQLLDQTTRAKLIESFNTDCNLRRKAESFKGYECLKDKTSTYVAELLLKQFDPATVAEMQYAITNISVLRKVIDKLAKVYANGAIRTMPTTAGTAQVEGAAKYLSMNTAMKKANRYYRTFKNTLVYVKPRKADNGGYDIAVEVLPPFHYDAVENPDNPEAAMAIVLSDYIPQRKNLYSIGDAATANRGQIREVNDLGDKLVQDYCAPKNNGGEYSGEDNREYIWWSKNFHFTTNAKGEIIQKEIDEDYTNPILKLPFVDISAEKDGCYFAEGGQDLIDTGVQINVDLTNIKHVGVSQGYGQLYMTGKNLPKSVKVGPNHCVQLEQSDKDEPAPTIGYLNSNPPLDSLQSVLEMEVALMLTTNNLSVSSFSTSLSGGKDFASGIALIIDRSESIEDIEDQSEIFLEKEPKVWGLVSDWTEVYGSAGMLSEESVQSLGMLPDNIEEEIQIYFPDAKPMLSESEELAVIEKRKELGLNTMVELIMRDNQGMTEADAKEKLAKIQAEKQANMDAFVMAPAPNEVMPNGNQSQENDGNDGSNNGNTGIDGGPENTPSGEEPNQE